MCTFRNERSGEIVNTKLTREQILKTFQDTTDDQNWLWFWLAKHAERNMPRGQEQQQIPQMRDMIAFLGDSFMFAIGMGLKRPMIRLHYKGRRYKVYLSARGTLCFKSGALIPGTNDPQGDEEYMGCLWDGRFLPNRDRRVLPIEQEMLDELGKDPAGFFSKVSKDMDRCCYCGKALEDQRSKDVGYGKTCADHWGLPWGKSYDDKVPSFASLWANSDTTTKNNVRGLCIALRDAPYDSILWGMLGDVLEGVGYTKKPTAPERSVRVPTSK